VLVTSLLKSAQYRDETSFKPAALNNKCATPDIYQKCY
jgi:hypothetical protein